jgi:RimJ/RimL family protein N-acetyltransferase
MLVEVPAASRERLRPLFADYPGWYGITEAILSGAMGRALADNLESPSLALLEFGFERFAAGDVGTGVAETMHAIPDSCFLVVPESWNETLERDYTAFLTPNPRTSFRRSPRQRQQLLALIEALPSGFELVPITSGNVDRFAKFESSLVRNFGSRERFLSEGAGFAIEHEGQFVCGCSSFAAGGGKIEVEIDTHPAFQRRGLASAAAAALILHCIDHAIEPCWDAANLASAALATKLGFRGPRQYVAYMVHPVLAQ